MKKIKYFVEFILIVCFFFIFKIIGYKNASNLGEFIGKKIGPIFQKMPESSEWIVKGKRFFDAWDKEPEEQYISLISYFSEKEKSTLLKFDTIPSRRIIDNLVRDSKEYGATDFFEKLFYIECNSYLPNNILEYTDKTSMAVSLEVREPLLDHKLVEFAANIPFTWKIKNSSMKYILKLAMKDILPKKVLNRKKRGFTPPLINWLDKSLPDLESKYLSKHNISEKNILDYDFVKEIINDYKNGKKKNVVALTADLKDSMKLSNFANKYPKQFFEFGIAEQNMMSAAAGMTIVGKIPFVTSYAAFNPGRNWDQLRVSVCYSNANVKIIGGHAGLTTGPDGASHQCLEDIALTRTLPNLVVLSPCDEEEARKAVIAATKHKGPVYIRLSREKSKNLTVRRTPFKIGEASVLEEGKDITIIATGITVQFTLKAAKELKKAKIKATVINLSTIKPLDEKTILKYAKKTGKIITIEDHQKAGGMGSAVSEFLSQNYPCKMKIIGVQDSFGESGNGYELLEKYKISVDEIVACAKDLNN